MYRACATVLLTDELSGTKFACQLHSINEYPEWINGVNRTAYDIHRIAPKRFVIARK